VGVDGSGKTTQAHRLADALTRSGLPAAYGQNAGGRRWFGRLAKRLGRGSDAQRLLGRAGLLLVESILRWLAIARTLLRARLHGQVAVMDRYAVCQFASIRALRGSRMAEWVARRAYSLFPRPDLTFFLAIDPAEAVRRIDRRGEDHESEEFLAASAAAYRSLPEFGSFAIIDASGTPDEVAAQIAGHFDALPAPSYARP
jgi:dTMP kinase